jgi:hypothetical protein
MIKLYLKYLFGGILILILFENTKAQMLYVQNNTLSIQNNGVLAVHNDLILDSANIIGTGTLLLTKKGIQKIITCHSNISKLVISSNTKLEIIGNVLMANTSHQNKTKSSRTPNSEDYLCRTPKSKKKVAEKPKIEDYPMKDSLRHTSTNMYGLHQTISFTTNNYFFSLSEFIVYTNLYTLHKPDTDYSPPEKI